MRGLTGHLPPAGASVPRVAALEGCGPNPPRTAMRSHLDIAQQEQNKEDDQDQPDEATAPGE